MEVTGFLFYTAAGCIAYMLIGAGVVLLREKPSAESDGMAYFLFWPVLIPLLCVDGIMSWLAGIVVRRMFKTPGGKVVSPDVGTLREQRLRSAFVIRNRIKAIPAEQAKHFEAIGRLDQERKRLEENLGDLERPTYRDIV